MNPQTRIESLELQQRSLKYKIHNLRKAYRELQAAYNLNLKVIQLLIRDKIDLKDKLQKEYNK